MDEGSYPAVGFSVGKHRMFIRDDADILRDDVGRTPRWNELKVGGLGDRPSGSRD